MRLVGVLLGEYHVFRETGNVDHVVSRVVDHKHMCVARGLGLLSRTFRHVVINYGAVTHFVF